MVKHLIPRRMFKPVSVCFVLALLIAAGLAGCGGAAGVVTQSQPVAEPRDTSALETLFWARVDSARTSFTRADVDFMTGMIGHHAQALVMSALAPTHGASHEVRTLASRITNAQQDEIRTMQQWLRDRGRPVPQVHIEGLNLMIHGAGGHGMHAHMDMPGMLSQEQLEELNRAKGKQFDRLFLTYMIQHHGGAIVMVDHLLSHDGAAQDGAAFKLASDINVDQATEIARMKRMLASISP